MKAQQADSRSTLLLPADDKSGSHASFEPKPSSVPEPAAALLEGAQFSLRELFKTLSLAAVLTFLFSFWSAESPLVAGLAQVGASLLVIQLFARGYFTRAKSIAGSLRSNQPLPRNSPP